MSTSVVDGTTGKIIQFDIKEYNYLNYVVVNNAEYYTFTYLLETPLENLLPIIYFDLNCGKNQ
jgi:hypothetical protein